MSMWENEEKKRPPNVDELYVSKIESDWYIFFSFVCLTHHIELRIDTWSTQSKTDCRGGYLTPPRKSPVSGGRISKNLLKLDVVFYKQQLQNYFLYILFFLLSLPYVYFIKIRLPMNLCDRFFFLSIHHIDVEALCHPYL